MVVLIKNHNLSRVILFCRRSHPEIHHEAAISESNLNFINIAARHFLQLHSVPRREQQRNSIALHCKLRGKRRTYAKFSWEKDGLPLLANSRRFMKTRLRSERLKIKRVRTVDSGKYRCLAIANGKRLRSKAVKIVVPGECSLSIFISWKFLFSNFIIASSILLKAIITYFSAPHSALMLQQFFANVLSKLQSFSFAKYKIYRVLINTYASFGFKSIQ